MGEAPRGRCRAARPLHLRHAEAAPGPMRRFFADTYYWIALLNDKDQGHAAARAISQTLQQDVIVTTQEVLSEVLTHFSGFGRLMRSSAAAFIRHILSDPTIEIRPQS